MTDFNALEEIDGIRLTWNIWPNSKLEATKAVIPFAAMYTPNKKLPNMPVSSPDELLQLIAARLHHFISDISPAPSNTLAISEALHYLIPRRYFPTNPFHANNAQPL